MHCRRQSTSESEKSQSRTSSTTELRQRLSRNVLKKSKEMSQLVQEEKAESGHVRVTKFMYL